MNLLIGHKCLEVFVYDSPQAGSLRHKAGRNPTPHGLFVKAEVSTVNAKRQAFRRFEDWFRRYSP